MTDTIQASPAAAPPRAKSPWPRRILIGLATLFLLACLIVALAFALTAGPVKAADAFFEATARRGAAASYAMAAQPFRDATSLSAWDEAATRSGMKTYAGASWNSREVQNGAATLNGALKTAGGGALPVVVHLVKTASGWAVLSLDFARGGVMDQAAADRLVRTEGAERSGSALDPSVQASAPQPSLGTAQPGYPSPELSSVSPPPMGPLASAPAGNPAMGGVLGAQVSSGDGAPDMIPGAEVAGICINLMRAQSLPVEGVECLQPLPAQPGRAVRCIVRAYGGRVGMTATLRSYDPALSRPAIACAVDREPMAR